MIKLGPAGTNGDTIVGITRIKGLALDAVEIEFTHGVHTKNELAKRIGIHAKTLHMDLSVHAPYFINLASEEKEKREASKKRILDSVERAHYMGATVVVFHAAYYGKHSPEECYQIVKEAILDMQATIKAHGWKKVMLAPETTGKHSQFGTVDELLRLKKETGCSLCIDFSHIYARNNGTIDYDELFEKLKNITHIHSHFSGIEFTQAGERRHLIMPESFFEPLARQLLKRNIDITIISESPVTFEDSLKMKKILERLKK